MNATMPNGIGSRLDDCLQHKGSRLWCDWGKRLILLGCFRLFRLYNGILHGSGASALEQGRSEKEWTLEREELVVRSNCFHRHCTMVNWTNGMTGRGS